MSLERYKSSPNQERIVFDNYSRAEKTNNSKNGVSFIYATREDEYKAMRLLKGKGNAFLLWRYFLDNISWSDEKNVYWLSPQAIENDIELTENMYDTAKKALISHGFLTWEGGEWHFHPVPKTPQPKPKEAAKQSESKQIEQPEPVQAEEPQQEPQPEPIQQEPEPQPEPVRSGYTKSMEQIKQRVIHTRDKLEKSGKAVDRYALTGVLCFPPYAVMMDEELDTVLSDLGYPAKTGNIYEGLPYWMNPANDNRNRPQEKETDALPF